MAVGRSSPLIPFLVAALGIAVFSAMDAVMKGLVLAIGAYNALTWRMMASTVLSGGLYAWRRPAWPDRAILRVHITRALLSAVMAFLFFWGLARVPIAQAVALTFIAPLIALFLAAWLLGERVRMATVLGSMVAMAGVGAILVGQAVTPAGPEAVAGSLAVLASACCYAWNIVLMRQQAMVAGPIEISFFQSVIVCALYLLAAPWLLRVPPAALSGAIVAGAVMTTASLMLLSWAYARAEANLLSMSEYTAFLWGATFGWVFFGERLALGTLAGAGLIVIGCLVALRRRDGAPVADAEAAL